MDRESTPESTDFIELHGRLCEHSELECRLPGAQIRLEEHPPLPEYLKPVLQAAGLKDDANGKESYEIHLEMPGYENNQLEVMLSRQSRAQAIKDGEKLERTLEAKKQLSGQVKVHILSYPSENKIVPAMLWADLTVPGIGEVSVSSAADTLSEALRTMQRVLPGASINS